FKHTGTVDVRARTSGNLISVSGSLGVATGSGGTDATAVGGTITVNLIDNTITAEILDSTTTTDSTGNVTVLADDDAGIYGFAGGFALGKSSAYGVAVALNVLDNTVRAKISNSVWHTSGAVTVRAEAHGAIGTAAVGGAGSKESALAGSAA